MLKNLNLTGQFLIAMPSMTDQHFSETITFICTHNEDGAMGIVINRPADFKIAKLLNQVSLTANDSQLHQQPVFIGGPVQPERGFVLHAPVEEYDATIQVNEAVSLTVSSDILNAVAESKISDNILIALGYAGWSAGQLEQEMGMNAWLNLDTLAIESIQHLIFEEPVTSRFKHAMQLMGLDMSNLSDVAGHA